MRRGALLLGAALLDVLVGDPQHLPHPVRAIGWAIGAGERALRKGCTTAREERMAGAVLTVAVVGASTCVTAVVLGLLARANARVEDAAALIAGASSLASRNLLDEVGAVAHALEQNDVEHARLRLARVVGRDTTDLDEPEIARAAIETLAESLCDGVVAPFFYMALGGVPGAFAYKAVNTLDSMIGHVEPPYRDFGAFAAHADDIANYVPARLAAATIVAAAYAMEHTGARAWRVWMRDGANHASPNAGQPEAAMAGALGVRLGGRNTYDGVAHDAPHLGGEFSPPRGADVLRALTLTRIAALFFAATTVAIVEACDALR